MAVRRAAIAGIAEFLPRKAGGRSAMQIIAETSREALSECDLKPSDVHAVFNAGVPGSAGLYLSEYLGLQPRVMDSTMIGGSSFEAHINHAVGLIETGRIDAALITYGSTVASDGLAIGTGPREGIGVGPGVGPQTADSMEAWVGLPLVGNYALVAARHMYEYGTTSEQLAAIAVSTRYHASLNPNARYRDPITVADVLASPVIADPLHLLDCCLISDGGGAVVVMSEERARSSKKPPVLIIGAAEAAAHTAGGRRDITTTAAAESGPRAFQMAGISPSSVDMAMLYDSFTITVLCQLEDLGFCRKGEGGHFVSHGNIQLGGRLPVNTDGGGLSNNHPGMRGIFLIIEAVRQLRGECGDRQVPNCRIAVANGLGVSLASRHTCATVVLARD